MPVNRAVAGLRAWLALCGLAVAGPLFAQDADLTLYVFNRGLPETGIEVLVDGTLATVTDENGVALLDVAPGLRKLELREQDLVVFDQQVLLTAGEVAQWIVNITRGGGALVDVESSGEGPGVAAQQAEAAEAPAGPPGRLVGRLVSADGGEAIAGARIFISGQTSDVRTAEDGRFEIDLPPGTYSLSVLHSGYNTVTRDEIEVASETETPVQLELTPAGSELPEFVVIEPYIAGSLASVLEERRTEVAVANILGAEQISKAGDSDAAGALKRVTGLTLVGGRFIYVRGLGERYSSTILNGADVPSPDPTRRVVPLDLFPTSIIDSIAVQKGFTPEMPGEFGGGSVQLRTKSIPESGFLTMELSMGYNDQTTFKDGLTYDGGGSDWTGFDDGTRDRSAELIAATADGTRLAEFNRFTGEGYTPEELEVIGESLPVNYDIESNEPPPNLGFNIGGGNVFEFGEKWRAGFLGALEYGNDWNTASQVRIDYINSGGGVLEEESRFEFNTTFNQVNLSGFFTAGIEYGELHSLSYNWMLLRNTTNRTQVEQGNSPDAEGGEVRFTELEWFEREMNANQLIGSHAFPFLWDLKLDWQYTTAAANSSVPDTRRYRYDPDRSTPEEDDFVFSLRNDSNQRRWSDLEDNSDNWRVDLVQPIPLPFFDTIDFALTGGVSSIEKDRDSTIRRFAFQPEGAIARDTELRRNPSVEDIIFADTIDPNGWQLREVTIVTDAYTATQVVDAWYVGLDVQAGEWLRLGGGIRQETSDQDVTTFDIFSPDRNPVVSSLSTDNRLPAATATFLFGDHQIRAGYGETVNRPDFKELSPAFYKDPILDRLVVGNPDLEAAFITHYDIRWDYYFNPGEFISLGAFYKEFDQPIESVILAGAEKLVSFDNAEAAENVGVEFEFYKSLGFVNDWWEWGAWWERLYVNTNYAWIDSEITLSDEDSDLQTSRSRPLQGQSPYVWNFQLGYDDEEREINTALVFNIFGERIVDVGILGTPDIYEEPRPSLDFVYKQAFGDWTVKFKLQNMLDPDIELTQGGELKRLTKAGREISLGLEWRPR